MAQLAEIKLKQAKKSPSSECVHCANCMAGMKELSSSSISLVLTDPPYFIDGMDDRWDHGKLRKRVKKGVIGGLPAGMKFTAQQGKDLYRFLLPVAEEWRRVLKPGGFVLCFSQPRLAHRAATAIEDAGFEIRDLLAWRYEGQAKAFSQEHFIRKSRLPEQEKQRRIAALNGRKTPQLKPQMESIVLAQAPRDGTYANNWLEHRVGLIDADDPLIEPGRFPGTVIPAKKPRNKHGHMTVKPVDLLRHLIRLFTAKGKKSIVLDPFAGSGSTGVAALQEARGFIGYELDPDMAKIANQRIQRETGRVSQGEGVSKGRPVAGSASMISLSRSFGSASV